MYFDGPHVIIISNIAITCASYIFSRRHLSIAEKNEKFDWIISVILTFCGQCASWTCWKRTNNRNSALEEEESVMEFGYFTNVSSHFI